ncbi:MAG: hypothetical protein WDO69_29835 [Pseudomonadota bacterium]
MATGIVACVLVALVWLLPNFRPLPKPLIVALVAIDPLLTALVLSAGGLLISRFLSHRNEPLLTRYFGTALCWTAIIGSALTLGYIEVIKIGMLL